MDIGLKFNKDFERALDSLREKYGEDFEITDEVIESINKLKYLYSTILKY